MKEVAHSHSLKTGVTQRELLSFVTQGGQQVLSSDSTQALKYHVVSQWRRSLHHRLVCHNGSELTGLHKQLCPPCSRAVLYCIYRHDSVYMCYYNVSYNSALI